MDGHSTRMLGFLCHRVIPDEAEAVARSRGLEIEWGPNRLLMTRYRVSAFEYFPQLDRNVLYSSIADDGMWFDVLIGEAYERVGDLPDKW